MELKDKVIYANIQLFIYYFALSDKIFLNPFFSIAFILFVTWMVRSNTLNQHCGILCATVTGPSLTEYRKYAQQLYYLLHYKLSNGISISYDWLSFFMHLTEFSVFEIFLEFKYSASGYYGIYII